MKKNNLFRLIFTMICILGLMTACGAPTGQETLDEGELTIDYLQNDYSDQLLTDGAEHLVGSIELSTAEDGSPQIILHPKEVASAPNSDGTYNVSSYVINRVLSVSDSLYATFGSDDTILDHTGFLAAVQADCDASGLPFDQYGDYILYDVYVLEDQVLLALSNSDYVLPQPEAK